jgi:hypothetical protein
VDWCTKPYDWANHNPVAAFGGSSTNGIIRLKAKPGDVISLDASAAIILYAPSIGNMAKLRFSS